MSPAACAARAVQEVAGNTARAAQAAHALLGLGGRAGDLLGATADVLGGLVDRLDDPGEALEHGVVGAAQLGQFVPALFVEADRQVVAALHRLDRADRLTQALADGLHQRHQYRGDQQHADRHDDRQPETTKCLAAGYRSVGGSAFADYLAEGEQAVDGAGRGIQPLLLADAVLLRPLRGVDRLAHSAEFPDELLLQVLPGAAYLWVVAEHRQADVLQERQAVVDHVAQAGQVLALRRSQRGATAEDHRQLRALAAGVFGGQPECMLEVGVLEGCAVQRGGGHERAAAQTRARLDQAGDHRNPLRGARSLTDAGIDLLPCLPDFHPLGLGRGDIVA